MEIHEFEERLRQYSHEVASANSESTKAFLFLEFIRSVFRDVQANNPHRLYPDLERYIKSEKTVLIKGRVDAFLGNLIIEFESNLKEAKREEAEGQLKRYTSILWNNKGIVEYLCVATDGLSFLIYRPRSNQNESFSEEVIDLQPVDKFDIREEDAATLYKRLDRYMLYQTLIPPTAEDIVETFGSKSVILVDCKEILEKAWRIMKNEAGAMYKEWSKYLSITYGSEVDSEELFLRHTYLATVAKLMVYSFYQENTLPTSKETISKILTGGVFKEWGIENFLVEDFFSWVVREKVSKEGYKLANRILDGLARYDLTKLDEDIFKELYQQLIDPKERHDLGEYYTPDWLAELIIKKVVPDYNLKVLDPSCGSGTFPAATIRHKLSLMSNIKPSEKVRTIVQTVQGMDVHPVAVLISKANYLMALGNLLMKKQGNITIPIYMADSIIFPTPTKSISAVSSKEMEDVYVYRADDAQLMLPRSMVDAESADYVIDAMKEFALKKANDPSQSSTGFKTYLQKRYGISQEQFDIISNTANVLVDLIKHNKDSIHPFILKNIYKPSVIGKFNVIVGNPPWLSYRFVKSLDRQEKLKELIISKYGLLDSKQQRNITNLELATLFLLRCTDVYLEASGIIAFVMPRSLFTADQHHNLRTGHTEGVKFGITSAWDLKVEQLFNVPSCVIIGMRGARTEYPLKALEIIASPPQRNSKLSTIENDLTKFKLVQIKLSLAQTGGRSAWSHQTIDICGGRTINQAQSDLMILTEVLTFTHVSFGSSILRRMQS